MLNPVLTRKWIEVLETQGHLQAFYCMASFGGRGCAIGKLATDVLNIPTAAISTATIYEIASAIGMGYRAAVMIAQLNDGKLWAHAKRVFEYDLETKAIVERRIDEPHRIRRHSFQELANILKIRLRAQEEFLSIDTESSPNGDPKPQEPTKDGNNAYSIV